ncbi:MAG: protein translocase subunit SecF [Patescibacteria group bacterium]
MKLLRWSRFYFTISGLLILIAIISLAVHGVRPSIDFVGGSLLEVSVEEDVVLETTQVRDLLSDVYTTSVVQSSGASRYIIKGGAIDNDSKNMVLGQLQQEYGTVEELRFETIGPALSRELLQKTLTAVVIVAFFILGYIARQFKNWHFGISAVVAMLHDAVLLIGAFSIFGWLFGAEVDVLFVTALLTTLAFSVHDTIVVYDRIRELRQRHPKSSWQQVCDTAVTETLTRSFNNSMTTILMLASLSLLGGESIRWFAVALLIGVVVGTYSSPFLAVPLLYKWQTWKRQ